MSSTNGGIGVHFLNIGCFITNCSSWYQVSVSKDRIQQTCERRATLVPLNERFSLFLGKYVIVCVLGCFVMDLSRCLLTLACKDKVNYDGKDSIGWFPCKFDDNAASRVPAYEIET